MRQPTAESNERSKPQGRVCNRAGCGQPIVGTDGRPRYDRNSCSSKCRGADKRERMQEKRRKAKTGRCPHCGRKKGEDSLADGRVPRHNAPSVIEAQMIQGEKASESNRRREIASNTQSAGGKQHTAWTKECPML